MKRKIKRLKINQKNVKKMNKAILFIRIIAGTMGFILSLSSIGLILYAFIYALQNVGS